MKRVLKALQIALKVTALCTGMILIGWLLAFAVVYGLQAIGITGGWTAVIAIGLIGIILTFIWVFVIGLLDGNK